MRLTVLLLLALALAGCQAPVAHDDQAEPLDPAEAEPEHKGNQFLLHGPRPVSNTFVSGGAEPSILADSGGKFLWIGDTDGGYYSTNNGTSWTNLPYFVLPGAFSDGWALAQDDEGAMYAMALTGPELEIAMSTDGTSWDYSYPLAQVAAVTDRPWLAARGDGEVAVIYYDYPLGESCARSLDGGLTWLDISRGFPTGAPQGGSLDYNADGDLMYVNDNGIIYTYADGVCLGGPSSVSMGSNLGANNMIQLDANEDGSFYIGAAVNGNAGVELYGNDGTQVKKLIVSPPELKSNTFVSISTWEDEVALSWYGSETPGDPSNANFNGEFNVFVARVTDFWGTPKITHDRLTTEPNHVGDICMGGIGCGGESDRDLLDYFGIDHDIWGGLHIAYGHDGAGSNAEVRYAHLTPLPITNNPPPIETVIASFTVSVNGASITTDATNSVGAKSFQWNWGDGTTGAGPLGSHTYTASGQYLVRLTVTGDVETDMASKPVSIIVPPPSSTSTSTPPPPPPSTSSTSSTFSVSTSSTSSSSTSTSSATSSSSEPTSSTSTTSSSSTSSSTSSTPAATGTWTPSSSNPVQETENESTPAVALLFVLVGIVVFARSKLD